MARGLRRSAGGIIQHVLNRGNGRSTIFHKAADAVAFLNLLHQVKRLIPMRILAYCLMGNHWHLVLWPHEEGDVSRFMHRLQTTHVRRYFQHYHDDRGGHLYQGRYKSFAVDGEDEHHLLVLLRYVEANPLRAGLVTRAEDWKWSSLRLWHLGEADKLLTPWPIERPANWLELVNQPVNESELECVRTCVTRGCPFGRGDWVERMTKLLGLEHTLRERGRPKKKQPAENQE